MRRIVIALAGTVSALVALFGYHTSTAGPGPATVATAPQLPGSSPAGAASTPGGTTVTGDVVQTRWGPVQVQVAVAGGRIADVTVPRYPNGNMHDQQVNAYALPLLRERVLAAQSAQIDLVSGATVTSDGYLTSLQSALDRAHL